MEKNMDYSHRYLVHYYDADSSQRLTLPSLIRYFEDIAILHSSSKGMDLDFYDENRCGWLLLKWDVSIARLPVFGETVTVGTRVNAMKRFLADRRFLMTAEDGNVLAEGSSNWLFVDTVRRRPLRVPENQMEYFNVALENEAAFVALADVVPATGGEATLRRAVRTVNSDIDTNRHVNNVSYVTWALDTLPHDFVVAHSPTSLKAQYRKELGIGCEAEAVASVLSPEETSPAGPLVSRHSIRDAAEEFCAIEIGWKRAEG